MSETGTPTAVSEAPTSIEWLRDFVGALAGGVELA